MKQGNMNQDFVEEFDACMETLKQEVPVYKEQEVSDKVLVVDTRPNSLFFLEQDEMFVMDEEWQGMPEFENEAEQFFQTILVKMETEEDFIAFQKAIGQNITGNAKSIHYPKREQLTNIDMFYIHDRE